MNRRLWITLLCDAIFLFSMPGNNAHAATVNMDNQLMQFSYTTNGGADGSMNAYGNNEVSVLGDVLRVQIGDSDGNRNISGVGIYEMKLTGQNLEYAKQMAELLCSPKDPESDVPVPDLYVAKCGGEIRSSYVRDFSRSVATKISYLMDALKTTGVQDGRKLVKLDLSLLSIERSPDGFLVSVRFENSGDYLIKFKTPDKWNTRRGKYMDILGVSGRRVGSHIDDDEFGLGLAGHHLVDPRQFPDDEVNLAPHSSVFLKMKAGTIDEFAAGDYDLTVGAFMNIEVIGIQSSLVRVDFHSDYKNPTRVTFDRGYPSTPQEREQWEAYQRNRLSYFPVNPGETFAEAGLYRAVRLADNGAYRSLQLVPFKAGDVATQDSVKMLMASASGTHLDGPVQWLWEGSAPTPVKPFSIDIIDGTQRFSAPEARCPRSGRWLARVRVRDQFAGDPYRYDLTRIVTTRLGNRMPAATADTDWEWLGV